MLDLQQPRTRHSRGRLPSPPPPPVSTLPPYRIKVVEPIRMTTQAEREAILEDAHFNLFRIPADQVMVDLLTDSGTSAMSAQQWSQLMQGDESYAGATSWFRLKSVLTNLTGMPHLFPVHQGRACERLMFEILGGSGKVIPGNHHFDTTRGNIEYSGAEAIDLVIEEGRCPQSVHPFKGNIDLDRLEELISRVGAENIPACIMTVTNNSGGGQPVSLENLRQTRDLCRRFGIPMLIDGARFAENAFFIQQREPGMGNVTIREIARRMFELSDGTMISAKKDGLVNIGGVLALRDDALAEQARNLLILTEGYVTYGGLAGRDLEAMAQGFEEVLCDEYLRDRIAQVAHLGDRLAQGNVPILRPVGGHAVYVDAGAMLAHIPKDQFPGQALSCALYRHSGVRSVEIGSVMFEQASKELIRLAIPRRVYTRAHLDYVAEALIDLARHATDVSGLRMIEAPPVLRHFSAKFEEVTR